jgi:hypothetical protein
MIEAGTKSDNNGNTFIQETYAHILAQQIMQIREQNYDPARGTKLLSEVWRELVRDTKYFVER